MAQEIADMDNTADKFMNIDLSKVQMHCGFRKTDKIPCKTVLGRTAGVGGSGGDGSPHDSGDNDDSGRDNQGNHAEPF